MSCNYQVKTSLPPEAEYSINPFEWGYMLSKFDVYILSMTRNIYVFKLVISLTLRSSKLIVILVTLGKSKLTLLVYFYWHWAGHSYFTEFGQDIRSWETIQTLSDKKFKNDAYDLAQVIFNDSISRNQDPASGLITSLQRFSLLFLSVTCFSDLCDKMKICMTKIKTQKVLPNWGNIF